VTEDADALVESLVKRIHGVPHKVVYVFSGAGSQALNWLLAVPGASRTLLEATVPYAQSSMVDLLGSEPAEYVSAETALAMAVAAEERAYVLADGSSPAIGLACTATIATDREKRGDHRCAVAVSSRGGGEWAYTLTLAKGERDRAGEEDVVSRLVLRTLAQACGVDDGAGGLSLGLLDGEGVEVTEAQRS
jgi:nicotinamide mononucleotide (NMN) deamidase PncC